MKWLFFHLILLLTVSSCVKEAYQIENLHNNKIFVLGHAGMGQGFKYPANSWESIEPLFDIGAMGTEIDVQLTKDKQLVLFHDSDLSQKTAMNGKVHSKNLSDLQKGLYVSPISSSINLLSLESLFQKTKETKPFFSLDIKLYPEDTTNYLQDFAQSIKELVEKYNLENTVMVESFNIEFLTILKQICPKLKLFLLSRDIEQGLQECIRRNFYGISTDMKVINLDLVKLAHLNQKYIMLWNVQTIEDQRNSIYLNPDFIQSDKPISLLKELKMYKK